MMRPWQPCACQGSILAIAIMPGRLTSMPLSTPCRQICAQRSCCAISSDSTPQRLGPSWTFPLAQFGHVCVARCTPFDFIWLLHHNSRKEPLMSDDFPKDAANHEMPSEDAGTHQIYDRLLALGAQWRDRSVPIDRLSAHLRSLVASEHLNETSNDYPLQEEFVLMNTPITQTQQTSSTRRYLIPAI